MNGRSLVHPVEQPLRGIRKVLGNDELDPDAGVDDPSAGQRSRSSRRKTVLSGASGGSTTEERSRRRLASNSFWEGLGLTRASLRRTTTSALSERRFVCA